jgi:hypothetical protein
MGTLSWSAEGKDVSLRWEERALVVRGRPKGNSFPALVPFRSLQVRDDGPVRFGGLAKGRGRLRRMEVDGEPADPSTLLAGRHPGIHLTAGTVRMDAARRLRTPGTGNGRPS